ncbi:hypothetical protein Bhyg_07757 [Pseudolycoriella hygida]|uniref:Uncharacterized protein n=1 Tax=Pseudolycoriella hygida TaxID=35572 RepID=A0A9Q0N3A3_9DIPT|nr:hypothetical protein Bhyg_07757 [Pseudolycoriella hygida]
MDVEPILNLFGEDFFKKLEDELNITIPKVLQSILILNDVECAQVLSRVNDEFIQKKEKFMQEDFNGVMVTHDQPMETYLGKYALCQQAFKFSTGQKIVLNIIIEHCAKALQRRPQTTPTITISNQQLGQQQHIEEVHETQSSAQKQTQESNAKLLSKMFQSLFLWMKSKPYFAEVRNNELQFTVVPNSFVLTDDGNITCTIKCPILNCTENCKVSYKAYRNYFVSKNKTRDQQRLSPPRWHLFSIHKHIVDDHCGHSPADNSESSTVSQQEYQIEGSTNSNAPENLEDTNLQQEHSIEVATNSNVDEITEILILNKQC